MPLTNSEDKEFREEANLFFDAAVQVALARELLRNPGSASQKGSYLKGERYYLVRNNGFAIGDFSIDVVRGSLLLEGKIKSNTASLETKKEAAFQWAKSIGIKAISPHITSSESKFGWGCGILIGFLLIFPGLLFLLLYLWLNIKYKKQSQQLLQKWIDAGMPKAGQKVKPEEQLESVEEDSPDQDPIESRILELNSMKNKGLISEEEYQTLRKKTLGL